MGDEPRPPPPGRTHAVLGLGRPREVTTWRKDPAAGSSCSLASTPAIGRKPTGPLEMSSGGRRRHIQSASRSPRMAHTTPGKE
ncbi:Hypothetical predicted protein [Pelobates cultripes]|uniref:Uncharacterized protein n=1 Tax=Pelobates cultripes TaxID=61616 RepID=A0AAD1T3I5_PELCU|nr:Hypothetical predicted protein [Pelobates cultripes]